MWHFAGPWIQDNRFPDGKEEGDQHFKVLREPELYKAGLSCGVCYMRICWPELRWNFRKEAACPEERCEQTDSNTLFFNDLQQKKFRASWPRFGGKGEKSGQPAVRKKRSKGKIKVNHRIMIWEIDQVWRGGAGWKRTYNLDKIICPAWGHEPGFWFHFLSILFCVSLASHFPFWASVGRGKV